ncbi:MAG: glycosyltransferase [Clostridia bacterium]|nr:glycosyltransferase [Clostridia bacterium]
MDFSVSMCVYGGDNPRWFKEAVNSILNQTVKPNEIVLVVDGPIYDELENAVLEFEKNDCVNCIRLPKNLGHGEARRIGLEACKYDLVAIMDADDISVPDRFEKQIAAFENDSEISIVGGQITEFIGTKNNLKGSRFVPTDDIEIKKYMKKRCPFNQPTVMFKKNDVVEVGGYIDWFCDEDYYLWIRLALADKKFANVESVIVFMRVSGNSYERRGGLKYFISEAKLQKFMLNNKVIGFWTYLINVTKRFVLQVLMPNKVRGWLFKHFARNH